MERGKPSTLFLLFITPCRRCSMSQTWVLAWHKQKRRKWGAKRGLSGKNKAAEICRMCLGFFFLICRADLLIHYFPALVSLSFAKSFGLLAPLHQRVVEEGLEHTWEETTNQELGIWVRRDTSSRTLVMSYDWAHLISGSLWSLISLRVTSQAWRKRPSMPIGPIACTIFWVKRKGTTSGTSNVSP